MTTDTERWLPVVGFDTHYAVSSLGRVKRIAVGRSTEPGRILSATLHTRNGYPRVGLCVDGVVSSQLVHRLVAAAFIGPDGGLTVNHKNGDRSDNRPENLEYLSRADNARHAFVSLGYSPPCGKGETHRFAKLTDADIVAIRAQRKMGVSCVAISAAFGVCPSHVSSICHSRVWKHIPHQ